MRPLHLARVSAEDVAANERDRAGYAQYLLDHPEDAQRFGIAEPLRLIEGDLLGVALDDNNQPAIYPLREILAADLPSLKDAAHELKQASAHDSKQFLRLGQLARRWGYSKQGVQKFLARHKDFPPPCFTLNEGQVRIWSVTDCERYERNHPELTSETAKLFKVRAFARARARKSHASA